VSARGAYGLRLAGLPDCEEVQEALVPAPGDWHEVRLRLERRESPACAQEVEEDGDVITVALPQGGRAVLDRRAGTVTLTSPRALEHDWLVHPALALVGSVFAGWLRRPAIHAGGFVAGDGAWAIVGGHESGKSSTLAWLASMGHGVLADDMLVLEGRAAFAGPRSIDLREATARLECFDGIGGQVRRGNRRRLAPNATHPTHPLRGWFVLRWHDSPHVTSRRLAAGEHLAALIENVHPLGSTDPRDLFDLLELPAFEVSRPRKLTSLPATADALAFIAGEAVIDARGRSPRPKGVS
jgi:hypothetical protein